MSGKVLVVDNDYFFVEFLSELLEQNGFEVVKAYDGKEGMEKLEADVFDLMFVDMVMPKIDGWELIKYVRRRYPDNPFPIIAVSGTIVEQLDELESIGADCYIIKGPLEKMRDQITEFLNDRKRWGDVGEKNKLVYDPGNIFPRRESSELIESLQFQKAIFESIGFGLLVVDQDGRIMSFNGLAEQILGCPFEKMINHLIPSIFLPESRKRLVDTMKKIVKSPDLSSLSCRVRNEDTRMRMTISLLRVENRQIGWIIALEEEVVS
jgi:two-component system, OmpR family, response regulator VicR